MHHNSCLKRSTIKATKQLNTLSYWDTKCFLYRSPAVQSFSEVQNFADFTFQQVIWSSLQMLPYLCRGKLQTASPPQAMKTNLPLNPRVSTQCFVNFRHYQSILTSSSTTAILTFCHCQNWDPLCLQTNFKKTFCNLFVFIRYIWIQRGTHS